MGPAQGVEISRLIITAFALGIGMVAVPLVLNFVADRMRRMRQKQDRMLQPLALDRRYETVSAPPRAAVLSGTPRMPMLQIPRKD